MSTQRAATQVMFRPTAQVIAKDPGHTHTQSVAKLYQHHVEHEFQVRRSTVDGPWLSQLASLAALDPECKLKYLRWAGEFSRAILAGSNPHSLPLKLYKRGSGGRGPSGGSMSCLPHDCCWYNPPSFNKCALKVKFNGEPYLEATGYIRGIKHRLQGSVATVPQFHSFHLIHNVII